MKNADKLVLVTGASRGIGKAIATHFAEQGYKVAGTATSDAGAKKIDAYLKERNADSRGYTLDVVNDEAIDDIISSLKQDFGTTPDVLINNAGITRDNLLMRMKDDEWSAILNTNLTSIFKLSKACLRGMMKKKWGRIISIGSVVGSTGNPGQANYAAAKAGVIGFSKSLASEIGSRGVTVNVVAPGFIETDMTNELSEDQKKAIYDKIPMGRLGQPDEIADAVSFLASDKAAYITGTTVHVNGGMFMS